MRLDLYLKTSRLVKRRIVARELCDENRVLVNGREARASKEIKPGDVIMLAFSSRRVEIEVLRIPDKPKKSDAAPNFRIIAEHRLERQDN